MRQLGRFASAVALLGALALAGCSGGRSGQAATIPALPSASAQPPISASAAASPSAAVSASVAGATAAASPSASAAVSAAPRPPVPVELIIPSIKVAAPIEQVGEDPDGAMSVPQQWDDVGWFKLGYRPGEPGNAVIDGHLDSTTDRAVFWDLHLLQPGDQIIIKQQGGSQLTFAVTRLQPYPYDQAPLSDIFGAATRPQLNLITCDGAWNAGQKNYSQRLVVYSKEVS